MALASLVALLPALGFVGLNLLVSRAPPHPEGEFCAADPQVTAAFGGRGLVLRYRTAGGQFVRLAVDPFQLGPNTFRVRLFDVTGAPATAGRLRLGFYRLEDTSPPDWVDTGPRADDAEYRVTRSLNLPGWWVVAVGVEEAESDSRSSVWPNASRCRRRSAPSTSSGRAGSSCSGFWWG
jgi:hypothetical protein